MRAGLHGVLLALVAALLGAAIGAPGAEALDPPGVFHLRVDEGEGWHPENEFQLRWEHSGRTPTAVEYQVRDAKKIAVEKVRGPWIEDVLEHVKVPGPGTYSVEVSLEDAQGSHGASATAMLRFDDGRPGPARAVAPAGWLGGGPTSLAITHPEIQPVSGIRGYAFSVEQGLASSAGPCASTTRCSPAETDLGGGIGDDRIPLGALPEGTSSVRVLAVSGSGMRSESVETTVLRVDETRPETALAGVPRGWSKGSVLLTASAADPLSGMVAAGPNGPFTAIAVDGGVPTMAFGDSVTANVTGGGVHQVSFFARDAAGNEGDGGSAAGRALVRIDEGPPRIAFSRLQDRAEPERIEATVTDPVSGAAADRGSIELRPAGTRQRFTPLPTVVAENRLVAHWDSDAFASGGYEFRATGYDAAGNSAATDQRAGGGRMLLTNPVKEPVAIEAGFGGRRLSWHRCVHTKEGRRCHPEVIESFSERPAKRSIPYGRATQFAGRLASASGAPLGGYPVDVVETFDPGADQARRTTTLHTAPDGTFVARLAAGPDRQVEASFAGDRLLTRAGSEQVRLEVLSGISLRASSTAAAVGGVPVVFHGRVGALGAPIPSTGHPVQLQFRLPGRPWAEFRTVQSDRRGRFRYAYSFSDDDSRGIRFQFRALVPAQDGWPYEPGTSRPVAVTGR